MCNRALLLFGKLPQWNLHVMQCKRNYISKRFKVSKRFGFNSGIMETCPKSSNFGDFVRFRPHTYYLRTHSTILLPFWVAINSKGYFSEVYVEPCQISVVKRFWKTRPIVNVWQGFLNAPLRLEIDETILLDLWQWSSWWWWSYCQVQYLLHSRHPTFCYCFNKSNFLNNVPYTVLILEPLEISQNHSPGWVVMQVDVGKAEKPRILFYSVTSFK